MKTDFEDNLNRNYKRKQRGIKRNLSMMLGIALLVMQTGNAKAFGLKDLFQNSSSQREENASAESLEYGLLPDPALITAITGELYREDYEFSEDYLCNAYLYDQPDDLAAFLEEYTEVAENRGFSVYAEDIDGYDDLEITDGQYIAILIPDFENHMLFLVEAGMEFALDQADAVKDTDSASDSNTASASSSDEKSDTEASASTVSADYTLRVGETLTLTHPDSATDATYYAYNWDVDDDSVVSESHAANSSATVITALSPGFTTVTAVLDYTISTPQYRSYYSATLGETVTYYAGDTYTQGSTTKKYTILVVND